MCECVTDAFGDTVTRLDRKTHELIAYRICSCGREEVEVHREPYDPEARAREGLRPDKMFDVNGSSP